MIFLIASRLNAQGGAMRAEWSLARFNKLKCCMSAKLNGVVGVKSPFKPRLLRVRENRRGGLASKSCRTRYMRLLWSLRFGIYRSYRNSDTHCPCVHAGLRSSVRCADSTDSVKRSPFSVSRRPSRRSGRTEPSPVVGTCCNTTRSRSDAHPRALEKFRVRSKPWAFVLCVLEEPNAKRRKKVSSSGFLPTN